MNLRKPTNYIYETESKHAMQSFKRLAVASTSIAAILLLASCASEVPKEVVSQADLAVNKATQSRAPQLAPLDLRKSRDHLDEAKLAIQDRQYEQARRLAEKAVVEAQLAEAKSEAANEQATLADLRESLNALREEAATK
jgi:hypothetical protein